MEQLDLPRRYALADLAGALGVELLGGRLLSEVDPFPELSSIEFAAQLPARWRLALEDPRNRAMWVGAARPGKDASRSGFAQSLANLAAHRGITEPGEIATIIRLAPACGNWALEKPKALQRTIAKALRGVKCV